MERRHRGLPLPWGSGQLGRLGERRRSPLCVVELPEEVLAERRIYRVVDDSIMWESRITRAHGGYAGDVITRCIGSKLTLRQTP
jgi:hypothetical protein